MISINWIKIKTEGKGKVDKVFIWSYAASCLHHCKFGSCDRNSEELFGFKNIVDNICQKEEHI